MADSIDFRGRALRFNPALENAKRCSMVRNFLFSVEDVEVPRITDTNAAFGRPDPVNVGDKERRFHRADTIPSGLQARGTDIDRQ